MRKARFTEHQIIAVLKSVKAGRTVKDICREAGISKASYIKKMKDLEDKNFRLKQMFARSESGEPHTSQMLLKKALK